MTQPKETKEDIADLARADLMVVREREGDGAALEHAARLTWAAAEFIAVTLGQPEVVSKMLNAMVLHLRKVHPEVRPEVTIPEQGPDALAALMGMETQTELHEVVRLISLDHASVAACMVARTALAFLVEVGQVDRFRETVKEADREVERLDAKGASRP